MTLAEQHANRKGLFVFLIARSKPDWLGFTSGMCVLTYTRALRNMGTEMSEKPVMKQYISVVSYINTYITFRS